jgi:hypothetical protein
MIVTFLIGFISIFFAFQAWNLHNRKYLFLSFFIIFIYLALRYNFGSDYKTYLELFHQIKEMSWNDLKDLPKISSLGETMEFGYIYLNKLFSIFSGFFVFIAFHSFIFCAVYYGLIKKNVDIRFAWLAIFILIFNTTLMVRSISGLRQGLAVFCFLFSIQYLIQRNIIKYVLCILLASSFHYSACILLPLYFLFSIKPVNKFEPLIYLSVFVFLTLFGNIFFDPIVTIITKYIPKYLFYVNDNKLDIISSGVGRILFLFLNITILFFSKTDTPSDRVFYRILVFYILLTPLGGVIKMIGRLTLYFAPAFVVVVPQLMSTKINRSLKLIFISILLLLTIYDAINHYTNPLTRNANFHYQTIVSTFF